ncbi:MAG TPA: protein arginine kinase [Lentisphaeria bacterium]|nr:MAG: protein arginine kinase [Lentisphaerae bacterium GWF2_49_21]HBC88325.1 protein arginine kinase [Lentisphaeria bacterium]
MQDNPVNKLFEKRVSWLADSGPEDDIAISSRIRLARNLCDLPFPSNASTEHLDSSTAAVLLAVEKLKIFKKFYEIDMSKLSALDRQVLLERRLISREFYAKKQNTALIMTDDEICAIMINEEDHLRMQAILSGLRLGEVWKIIDRMDDRLSTELPFAFDVNLGYLTSCPTNVGTGIRASVMLHLPGLVLCEQINAVIQAVNKLGLAVRGIFGEGTESLGNLFQISNQSTLGETEVQIIDRLESVIRQIINHEKNSRQKLLHNRREFLMNHIGRAFGILRHSYIVSSEETLNSLSALRLGVDMGMFSSVDIHTVNELFVTVQPGHLQKYAGKEIDPSERDIFRATLIRERLKSSEKK